MVDQDKFGARLRSLMDDNTPSPDEMELVQVLSDSVQRKSAMLQTFYSEGWPYIAQELQDGIDAAEKLILSGEYEDEPKKSAELRGQIRGYKALLGLPARVQQEIEIDEQELQNLRP